MRHAEHDFVDTEIGGCPVHAGEHVMVLIGSANLDDVGLDDADRAVLDRRVNRHLAFGGGVHRCLGSNLARLELKVAIEEFVARFPEFELAGDVRWSVGQIRGPRELPVRILPS